MRMENLDKWFRRKAVIDYSPPIPDPERIVLAVSYVEGDAAA